MRCPGRVEPRQTEAGVPVLRHRVAVPGHRHRRDPGTGPRPGAEGDARGRPGMADRDADGSVPQLQGGLRFRSRARRPALRVLRLARARRLQGDQVADTAAEPPALPRGGHRRPRTDSALVPEQVAGAGHPEIPRAGRYGEGRLHPVLDLRRAGRVPLGSGGGTLLLHDGDLSRQQGPDADSSGQARPMGTGRRHHRALLRRRADPGNAWRLARPSPAGGAVSHRRTGSLRHVVSLRIRRRALPGGAAGRRQGLRRRDARRSSSSCAPGRCPAIPTGTW